MLPAHGFRRGLLQVGGRAPHNAANLLGRFVEIPGAIWDNLLQVRPLCQWLSSDTASPLPERNKGSPRSRQVRDTDNEHRIGSAELGRDFPP